MSVEAEQQVAAAARLQLTWHYARLLTTKEHRQDALLSLDPPFLGIAVDLWPVEDRSVG
ncbi:MAG: hypothetical protein QOK16_2978 [Solirubrobacteraceae bacterium]|jgi:hypothetical protein|nr:hypothetical protein [Solirubrobacteraceae bacterium]MEA2187967.1 hypothetical protein [Solirubrobacteraceae bacterium]